MSRKSFATVQRAVIIALLTTVATVIATMMTPRTTEADEWAV